MVALLVRVTRGLASDAQSQSRSPRLAPKLFNTRLACIVQIQTAQCRAIGVCKRVRSSEAEGFGRGKQELWASDSKLTECTEDLEKEAKFHPYFASPVTGRHAGLGRQ